MVWASEAVSAGMRSRASDVFVAGAIDGISIAQTARRIQIARLRKRFGVSYALADTLAELAYRMEASR